MINRIAIRSVLFLIVVCFAVPRATAQVPGGQRTGQQPVAAKGACSWMPLAPEHEKYLNEILNYWEFKTSKIERYRCDFKRYEYEMTRRTSPTNQVNYDLVNKTYTEGKIQYAAPDKGLFKAEVIKHRTPPKEPGGQPVWQDQVGGPREHWVCDGESVFEFNHLLKQLIVRALPPDMKGKQIAEGPLPFMFGAKTDQIKGRFWVHVVTPKGTKNEFHLEAVPKTLQDAQNFRMLHIIIDGTDFLPKAMVLFHRNNSKTTFLFENREVNWNMGLAAMNVFRREFYEPALPARDWKKVIAPVEQAATGQPAPPRQGTATRPQFGPIRQAQTPQRRQSRQ